MLADYFDENIIFHTHIAKAAGSSLAAGLQALFGQEAAYDLNDDGAPPPAMLSWHRRRGLRALTGHFWYGNYESHFERRPVYIATVRDPVERFVSLYGYVMSQPVHPYKARFKALGIDGSAEWFFADPVLCSEISNSLGVQTANVRDDLDARYAIVVPHKEVNRLTSALFAYFGRGEAPSFREKPAAGRYQLRPDVERRCRKLSRRDTALCQTVEENYERWLGSLGDRMRLC